MQGVSDRLVKYVYVCSAVPLTVGTLCMLPKETVLGSGAKQAHF